MVNARISLTIACFVGLAFVLLGAQKRSAPAPMRWEYCLLRLPLGYHRGQEIAEPPQMRRSYTVRAHICYMEGAGCRWETVQHTVTRLEDSVKFPQPQGPHDETAVDDVTAKALFKLGTEGWELQSDGPQGSIQTGERPRVLYFRRPLR